MSVMEEQMKSNNESISTVDESKTTEEPSMETSGEQFEKIMENISRGENNFGPHGTGGNGEIHVPACLTGSYIVPNDKTFLGGDQTFGPGTFIRIHTYLGENLVLHRQETLKRFSSMHGPR